MKLWLIIVISLIYFLSLIFNFDKSYKANLFLLVVFNHSKPKVEQIDNKDLMITL